MTTIDILQSRPELDDHDFNTIRDLYGQAQNWARHYETLIVSTNTFFVSASTVFIGLSFKEGSTTIRFLPLLITPILMSVIALLLTRSLFSLYANCVLRLILYENLLNCFVPRKIPTTLWNGRLLPTTMAELPVRWPASARFFRVLHISLLVSYVLAALAFQRFLQ